MGQNEGQGGRGHAFDTGGLTEGGGANALQLLADFVGQPDHRPIIQPSGQGAALIPAEGDDVGILAIQVAGILGVDLKLLDHIGGHGDQFRPDPGQVREPGKGKKLQTIAADPVHANGQAMFGGLIGGHAQAPQCFT